MQGIPFELTDKVRAQIVKSAKKGLLLKDIVRSIGLKNMSWYHEEIKKRYPEIEELIEEGRAQLREQMLEMSQSILHDHKDPARPQEINRLHRIAKTEETESVQNRGEDGKFLGGFTVEIIPNKKPAEEQPK